MQRCEGVNVNIEGNVKIKSINTAVSKPQHKDKTTNSQHLSSLSRRACKTMLRCVVMLMMINIRRIVRDVTATEDHEFIVTEPNSANELQQFEPSRYDKCNKKKAFDYRELVRNVVIALNTDTITHDAILQNRT